MLNSTEGSHDDIPDWLKGAESSDTGVTSETVKNSAEKTTPIPETPAVIPSIPEELTISSTSQSHEEQIPDWLKGTTPSENEAITPIIPVTTPEETEKPINSLFVDTKSTENIPETTLAEETIKTASSTHEEEHLPDWLK